MTANAEKEKSTRLDEEPSISNDYCLERLIKPTLRQYDRAAFILKGRYNGFVATQNRVCKYFMGSIVND